MAHRYRVELLRREHDRAPFTCGIPELDRYLHDQARQDQEKHRVAAVYVLLADDDPTILGYYTLSAAAIEPVELAPEIARRLPRYPTLPVILLGRLAVDQRRRGQGLGSRLLGDALTRALSLSTQLGALAVIVQAKGDDARRFYERVGFQRFASRPDHLYLAMKTIADGLGSAG
ncbi:MAG TPA: GNAT family N-acetyltransferase [Thermomicrobiaceae bacterium]|nr:GNAT family N-acetyltransferase [Thermomicrobiaceae bacterium]